MLVEYEEERNQLVRMLADCTRGAGGVAVITGGLSSGKTEVIHDLTERAERDGFIVLRGMASTEEQEFPYALFEQLLERARVGDQVAAAMHGHALGATPASVPPHVLRGVLQALVALSNDAPVLVAIDDVQCADALSLKCLLYLIRRIRSGRIAIIVTYGVQRCAARPALLGELLYQSHVRQISLGMLSESGVARLIAQEYGETSAACLAGAYTRATGGNPSLVRALLHDQKGVERSDASPARPVPRGAYRETTLACIHRAGPAAVRVARAIALLNGFDSVPIVSGLADLGESETRDAIQTFAASGILNGRTFRHSAMRVAVLNELDPSERMRLHYSAARLLRDIGVGPVAVARHLLAAAEASEPWATTVLCEAADELLAEDRVNLAVRCLRLAERSCEDPKLRVTMMTRITWWLWRIRPKAARSYAAVALSSAPDGPLGLAGLQLIGAALWFGWADSALGIAEKNAGAWDGDDPRVRSEAAAVRAWVRASIPDLRDRILPLLPEGTAEETGLSGALATLMGVLSSGDGSPVVAEQILQQVQRLDPQNLIPATYAMLTLIYADHLDSAVAWCDQIMHGLQKRHTPSWTAVFCGLRAMASLRRGDISSAHSDAAHALSQLPLKGWGELGGIPLASLIEASAAMGDHETAASATRRPLPRELFHTRSILHYLHARGRYHLSEGRDHAALGDFLACGERMQAWGLDSLGLVPWRSAAAEAYLRLGDRGRAERLAAEELAMTKDGDSRHRANTLRVVAATGPPERRVEILDEALAGLPGNGYDRAAVLADLGVALRQARDNARAEAVLRQARATSEACGAAKLRQAVLRELSALSSGASGNSPPAAKTSGYIVPRSDGTPGDEVVLKLLTMAERRVASLATRGYSNREISRRLFITVSTVEQHLTHIYRKCGIRRRNELATVLSVDGAD